MTFENKLVTLASGDPTLQSYFGTPPSFFRFFDRQLAQGYYKQGLCCQFLRVSTVRQYYQSGLTNLSQPRIQFTVRGALSAGILPENVRAAVAALITWLGTVSFSENNDFASPPTTPPHSPNFVLNEREGMDAQLDPAVYWKSIDVRFWNLES